MKLMREGEVKKDLKRKPNESDHLPPPLKCMRFSSPHDKDPDSDHLPPVSPRVHYQISELTWDFINLPRFLAENSEDNALIVRNHSHISHFHCSLKRNRILTEIYATISWCESSDVNSMVAMIIRSPTRITPPFTSTMVASTSTRQQGSTSRHMTCDGNKTQPIQEPNIKILWYSHMKMHPVKDIIPTGTLV